MKWEGFSAFKNDIHGNDAVDLLNPGFPVINNYG